MATSGTRFSPESAARPVTPPSRPYSHPTSAEPKVRCAALVSAARSGRWRRNLSPTPIASGAMSTANGQPRSRIAYAETPST